MPMPIVPIHQQERMPFTFGDQMQPEFQLSELQSLLLQATNKPVKKKYSYNTMDILQNIDKNTDLVVTAVSDSNERYCSVPDQVDDEMLFALKAEGLISGYGRSVKITDRGRTALRDHYLSTKNALNENKPADKFDYRSFLRIAFKKEQ
jgi:hypothetical protein